MGAAGGHPAGVAGPSATPGAQLQPLFVQLKFKSLKLTTNAALQRRFGSPFVFREEDPSRQVSQDHQPPGWETRKKCGAGRCHAAPAALGRLQHRALTPQGKAPRMAEGLEPGTSSSPKLRAPAASPPSRFCALCR